MGEKPFDRVTGFLEAESRVISLARSAEDRPAFFAAFRQLHEEHCARGLRFSPYTVERMTPQTVLEKGIGVRPRPLFRLDRVRCANGEQAAVAYVGDTCSEAGTLTMALFFSSDGKLTAYLERCSDCGGIGASAEAVCARCGQTGWLRRERVAGSEMRPVALQSVQRVAEPIEPLSRALVASPNPISLLIDERLSNESVAAERAGQSGFAMSAAYRRFMTSTEAPVRSAADEFFDTDAMLAVEERERPAVVERLTSMLASDTDVRVPRAIGVLGHPELVALLESRVRELGGQDQTLNALARSTWLLESIAVLGKHAPDFDPSSVLERLVSSALAPDNARAAQRLVALNPEAARTVLPSAFVGEHADLHCKELLVPLLRAWGAETVDVFAVSRLGATRWRVGAPIKVVRQTGMALVQALLTSLQVDRVTAMQHVTAVPADAPVARELLERLKGGQAVTDSELAALSTISREYVQAVLLAGLIRLDPNVVQALALLSRVELIDALSELRTWESYERYPDVIRQIDGLLEPLQR